MRHLRLLITAFATICVMALAAFALINRPQTYDDGGDVIVIKGGSLEIQCGKHHGNDCLGTNDSKGRYKAKKGDAHITRITIRDVTYPATVYYTNQFDPERPPQIEITYCEPGSTRGTCKPVKAN